MLAFIRGADTFFGPGQVYVKMLPDGAPVALTHDATTKMAPTFSPDGSVIAYGTCHPVQHVGSSGAGRRDAFDAAERVIINVD